MFDYFLFLLLLQKKEAKKTSFFSGEMVCFAHMRFGRGLKKLASCFAPSKAVRLQTQSPESYF